MMMKNFRKGQAALEFLTTYGWAFLVILVMIGALGYFGVFDVSRFVPESCKLDGTVECPVVLIDIGDSSDFGSNVQGIQMQIQNNQNEDIQVQRIVLQERRNPQTQNATGIPANADWSNAATAALVRVPAGQQRDINFAFEDLTGGGSMADANVTSQLSAEEGAKLTFDVRLFYQEGTSALTQVATGSMTASIN